MRAKVKAVLYSFVFGSAAAASASALGAVRYDVAFTVRDVDNPRVSDTVTGYITTDGSRLLRQGDILALNLHDSFGNRVAATEGRDIACAGDCGLRVVGNELRFDVASRGQLLLKSDTRSAGRGQFDLSAGVGHNAHGMFRSNSLPAIALTQNVTLGAAPAPTAAPEMDPATAGSGLALLAGLVLVMRGRRSGRAIA